MAEGGEGHGEQGSAPRDGAKAGAGEGRALAGCEGLGEDEEAASIRWGGDEEALSVRPKTRRLRPADGADSRTRRQRGRAWRRGHEAAAGASGDRVGPFWAGGGGLRLRRLHGDADGAWGLGLGRQIYTAPWLWVGLAVGVSGPPSGRPANSVPGRASPRAGVAAQARARLTGRASPGTVGSGPCRAWTGPNLPCFGQANGLRTAWTTIGWIGSSA